jgi:hypothetical protein
MGSLSLSLLISLAIGPVQVLGVHFLDETKLYVAASRVDYST